MEKKLFIGILSFLLFVSAVAVAAFYLWQRGVPTNEFNYQRNHPQVIKGVLDPGPSDTQLLVTEELGNIRALGANTIYVYVDYSYRDGQLEYTSGGGRPSNQDQLERDYIDLIKLIKQKGFAVHLALAFGGGANTSFGVPVEKLLADIGEADLKWAAIGEQYQVENFAPSSEIDFQIFREYYKADWQDTASFNKAVEVSNKYHDDVLPGIREVFGGKVIYQAGLWSSQSGSKGYDIFGMGVNSVGREVSNFRELVMEIFGYAQINAKRQGGDWMVTELWIPVNQAGVPSETPSGVPYMEIQADLYEIVFEEYRKLTGPNKPIGLSFTSYLGTHAKVKDTPSEAVIAEFFQGLNP